MKHGDQSNQKTIPVQFQSEHSKVTFADPDLEEIAGHLKAHQRRKLGRKFLKYALQCLDTAAEMDAQRDTVQMDLTPGNRNLN